MQNQPSMRICIIGSGAAGLTAVKLVKDSQQYLDGSWTVNAYEAREDIGGVWLPADPIDDPPLTPMYDSLTTNLPHPIMAFSCFPFPPSTPLFPLAETVQTYLKAYAKEFELSKHVRLNTHVDSVKWTGTFWLIGLSTGETLDFDRVIVANGHYRVPLYPDTPGLDRWLETGKAKHSAWYRKPEWKGNTVLVVGAGPSGQDICDEMQQVSPTVIHSISGVSREDIGNLKRRGRVVRFADDGTVQFEDGSTESGIDHCILATGYETSFPFLRDIVNSMPPPVPPLPQHLYNSSQHVFPFAKELFPIQADFPATSIAFMGLPVRVVPFPLFEAQARAILKVFADPAILDVTMEAVRIIQRYEDLRRDFGSDPTRLAHMWHRMRNHEQFEYRDELHELARCLDEFRVLGWETEIYDQKNALRREWRALEAAGDAEEWVKGVGQGGLQEWIDLMRKVLRRAQDAPPSRL